jgi:hypothetical protein
MSFRFTLHTTKEIDHKSLMLIQEVPRKKYAVNSDLAAIALKIFIWKFLKRLLTPFKEAVGALAIA